MAQIRIANFADRPNRIASYPPFVSRITNELSSDGVQFNCLKCKCVQEGVKSSKSCKHPVKRDEKQKTTGKDL